MISQNRSMSISQVSQPTGIADGWCSDRIAPVGADNQRHFSLTTGSSPWSFWRRRVPFKTTDLRHPVLGEITERQGVTPAQE